MNLTDLLQLDKLKHKKKRDIDMICKISRLTTIAFMDGNVELYKSLQGVLNVKVKQLMNA